MARTSITFEQVAAIANALYAEGSKDPGTAAIRAELVKRAGPGMQVGSPNTIQRHLEAWRTNARPVDPISPAPPLPPQLAADIGRALIAAAAVAKEDAERRLLQVRAELAELAEGGEGFEIQIDELNQALAARTSERDTIAGQLKEQIENIHELKVAFEREQATSEMLRLECTKAQLKSETADVRVEEAASHESALRSELAGVRSELSATGQKLSTAERRADVAEAHLSDANSSITRAEARFSEFRKAVQGIERAPERAAAAEAAVTELRAQVAMLNELLATALAKRSNPPPTEPAVLSRSVSDTIAPKVATQS